MISTVNAASMLLVEARVAASNPDAETTQALAEKAATARASKPNADLGAFFEQREIGLGDAEPQQSGNGARAERYLEKMMAMAKALARLQGSSVQAVVGNLPGGGIVQMSGGWTYNAEIEIYEGGGLRFTESLDGSDGDDTLSINTGDANKAEVAKKSALPNGIKAGGGNDQLSIVSQHVNGVDGGDGDDAIAIDAVFASNIDGGDGADEMAVVAGTLLNLDGGAGDDVVTIAAHDVFNVYGGDGDDIMTVAAERLINFNAGSGNDIITAKLNGLGQISAGEGDDIVRALSEGSVSVRGGAGDDLITVGGDRVALHFEGGDGLDQVQIERADTLAIGVGNTDLSNVEISMEGDRLTITHQDGSQMIVEGVSDALEIIVQNDDQDRLFLREKPSVDVLV